MTAELESKGIEIGELKAIHEKTKEYISEIESKWVEAEGKWAEADRERGKEKTLRTQAEEELQQLKT